MTDQRLSFDEYFIEMVEVVRRRSTCLRRSVGCVLVNERGHVLATGYNGVASGLPHCNHPALDVIEISHDTLREYTDVLPFACPGAKSESGTNPEGCQAIHAEQNALLQCRDVYEIKTAYVTTAPCITCTKLLMNTSCERIVFIDDYATSGELLWRNASRRWEKYGEHDADTT